ncbi:MAG: ribosome recycling factor [Rhodospirillales bacterium]|nr:ribosome recycling factor [Rhodospirillales bacterium]
MPAFDANTLKNEAKRRMDSTIEVLHKEFSGLRTGRASAGILEPIQVEAYGNRMPMNQVGTVGVADARLVTVQVWDKGLVKAVVKAIAEAGLGLNPAADGQLVRVPIPPLSEDRRKELSRIAHKYGEEARVAIRNVRRHAMDELKKAEKEHAISEDDHRKLSQEVQKTTDEYTARVDQTLSHKEKEILQV